MRRAAWTVLTLLPLAAHGGTAELPEKLAKEVDALAHEDAERREEATRTLMQTEAFSGTVVKAAMERVESREAAHRLMRIAKHRFFAEQGPSVDAVGGGAALGVRLTRSNKWAFISPDEDPRLDHSAFVVPERLPGFPAYAHLAPGDLLLGMDGEPFPKSFGWDAFKRIINEHSAGERVTATVLRNGERKKVSFRLDSKRRLTKVYSRQRRKSQAQRRWQRRRKALLRKAPDPTEISIGE